MDYDGWTKMEGWAEVKRAVVEFIVLMSRRRLADAGSGDTAALGDNLEALEDSLLAQLEDFTDGAQARVTITPLNPSR